MSAVANAGSAPTKFSEGTKEVFSKHMSASKVTCLDNVPTSVWGDPICGNGYVEEGEQCDCGSNDCTGKDKCCNGKTCEFAEGAVCSPIFSKCCDKERCNFFSLSENKVCREASSECDIPEKCDGTSAECPEDIVRYPGFPCGGEDHGACYAGTCMSQAQQCRDQAGIDYGVCKSFTADVCGALRCQEKGASTCTVFTLNGQRIMVEDGVTCNSDVGGGQCLGGKCVSSDELAPHPSCGNGVKEDGEECDCGDMYGDTSVSACCNCRTCKLTPGSECSSCDACCSLTCKILEKGSSACRKAVGPCDVEEVCNGKDPTCPPNLLAGIGQKCGDKPGEFCDAGGVCSESWSSRCKNYDSSMVGCSTFKECLLNANKVCESNMRCVKSTDVVVVGISSDFLPCSEYGGESFCYGGQCKSKAFAGMTKRVGVEERTCTKTQNSVASKDQEDAGDADLIESIVIGGATAVGLCGLVAVFVLCQRRQGARNKGPVSSGGATPPPSEVEIGPAPPPPEIKAPSWYYVDDHENTLQGPYDGSYMMYLREHGYLNDRTSVIQSGETEYMYFYERFTSPSELQYTNMHNPLSY